MCVPEQLVVQSIRLLRDSTNPNVLVVELLAHGGTESLEPLGHVRNLVQVDASIFRPSQVLIFWSQRLFLLSSLFNSPLSFISF